MNEPEANVAPSPYLPGTKVQFAIDSTSIGYMKTCPRLYQYIMLDGWSRRHDSVHLRFGIEYHLALQHYDVARSNGIPHEEAIFDSIAALVRRTQDWEVDTTEKAGRYKNRDTVRQLALDYLDHFAEDPAETYIKADGTPAVELSFRFELGWGPGARFPQTDDGGATFRMPQPYILCGHLDRVVNFNGQLLVMDRKTTTTTLGSYYFDQYDPNNQMSLYTLAGQVVLGTPIKGVIIDAAQVLLEQPSRFVRGFTYRTPDQTEEWLESLEYLLAIYETYAANDFYPMNDTACDKFGGCQFRNVCSKSPSVRERFLAADFTKLPEDQKWNPLKPR